MTPMPMDGSMGAMPYHAYPPGYMPGMHPPPMPMPGHMPMPHYPIGGPMVPPMMPQPPPAVPALLAEEVPVPVAALALAEVAAEVPAWQAPPAAPVYEPVATTPAPAPVYVQPLVATSPAAAEPATRPEVEPAEAPAASPTVQDAGAPSISPPPQPFKPLLPVDEPRPRNRFVQFWQKIGGGSLTFSLALHVGLILLAGIVVFTTTMTAKNVDFLPGGGTQQGKSASDSLSQKVEQKRRKTLSKSLPLQRVVSQSLTAAVSLPDVPLDTLDVPSVSSLMGGGSMASGGFGSMGSGNGFGGGIGMGSAKGFVGMTLFGKIGGDGLPGVFYDLKQKHDRSPTEFSAEIISEADYAGFINKTAAKKFSEKIMADFFHSTQKMSFTYLVVPYMAAQEGPKAFKVEHEVQPRGWFVHYGGMIQAPVPGDYRFVGMFDDALIVYINNKPVLDGSWYSIVDHEERRKDESIRQDFGGPILPGSGRKAYAGKWVKLDGSTRIDIVVGERPGGRVGGLLMVQAKKTKYKERSDGTPVLPVFSTVKMDAADLNRLREFGGADNAYELATETPVFTIKKPLFEKE